jgi:hypothetical protein
MAKAKKKRRGREHLRSAAPRPLHQPRSPLLVLEISGLSARFSAENGRSSAVSGELFRSLGFSQLTTIVVQTNAQFISDTAFLYLREFAAFSGAA